VITEALTIGTIFACCGLLTWATMKKYHSKIERRLQEIESHNTELEVIERRHGR